jgi:hypothetical protein
MVKLHLENFLECVRLRREPAATLEQGHRVATTIHLANISLRRKREIRWDPETETIMGDKEAGADLELPYREPWDRELRSLR